MNREWLLEMAPRDVALRSMSEPEQREAASAQILATIDEIAAENRQPDEWEAASLHDACQAMAARFYVLAINNCLLALELPEHRQVWPEVKQQIPRTLDELRELHRRCDFKSGPEPR